MKKLYLALALTMCAASPQAFADNIAPPVPNISGGAAPTLAPMLKRVMPGVVTIAVSQKIKTEAIEGGETGEDPFDQAPFNDPAFRRFFHDFRVQPPGAHPIPQERETQGMGSGVIIDAAKGYILTNNHVVRGADTISVITGDKRKLDAKIIGTDPETDIAVIQVKEDHLTQIALGDSDKLEIGDYVVAIGNPFGLSHTVTSGIVSALGRSGLGIEGYENFIQTDAAINPGNSGGALVNLNGELIGINTAIFSRSGGSMGIGFAIPINMARSVMDQIIAHGEVKRGHIGIHIQDITPDLAEAMDMKVLKGALVASVIKDSPADKAGLKAGDIVQKYNGVEVGAAADLKNMVGVTRLGDTAHIDLLRGGKPMSLTVKVDKFDFGGEGAEVEGAQAFKGAKLSALRPDNPLSGKVEGVEVVSVDPGSPAANAGLKPGDVIVSVNQQDVKTVEDVAKAAKKRDKGILLNIRRGDGALFLAIK